MSQILMTKKQWKAAGPRTQGYILYMQAELPGSELAGLSNPYREGTEQYEEFRKGEMAAVLEVQDFDD